ncbi:hypothetical protein KAR91_40200 [Candidatus Pacearchaeota archaeon]|nr:hypothetical protein [Candidatus Pacearchaeota archaeon]
MPYENIDESMKELEVLEEELVKCSGTQYIIDELIEIIERSRYVWIRDRASIVVDEPFQHERLDDMIRKQGDYILGIALDPDQKVRLKDPNILASYVMSIRDLGYVFWNNRNSEAWRILDNIFESNSFPAKIRNTAGLELEYNWARRYQQIHPWKSEGIVALGAAIVAYPIIEFAIELYKYFSNAP